MDPSKLVLMVLSVVVFIHTAVIVFLCLALKQRIQSHGKLHAELCKDFERVIHEVTECLKRASDSHNRLAKRVATLEQKSQSGLAAIDL